MPPWRREIVMEANGETARSGCPINAAVEALGDHWSLLVLRDVIFGDRPYFRELQAGSIEGIAFNILVDRLKKLVAAGIVSREDSARGSRVRYRWSGTCFARSCNDVLRLAHALAHEA